MPQRAMTWGMRALVSAGLLALVVSFVLALLVPGSPIVLPMVLTGPLPFLALGLVAWLNAPDHPVARRLLIIGSISPLQIAPQIALFFTIPVGEIVRDPVVTMTCLPLEMLMNVLIVRVVALLPDGQYKYGYERVLLRPLWFVPLLPFATLFFGQPAFMHPRMFDTFEQYELLGGFVLLVVRYLRGQRDDRRAMWWILLGCSAGLVFQATFALVRAFDVVFAGNPGVWFGFVNLLRGLLFVTGFAMAAFREGLFGESLVVRRSVTYRVLCLAIGVSYVGAAALPAIAMGQNLHTALVVLITLTATALFLPVRSRLVRLAARRVFGWRPTSHELLVQFGATLEHAFNPNELAPQLAGALRAGLDLRWVRVRLYSTDGTAIAVAGSSVGEFHEYALRHGDEVLGMIEYGAKVDGTLTTTDRELVATLARQTALAMHNSRQASELDASRARIVAAQDVERRRLERRLHDGIQQELVALVAKLRLARNQLRRDGTAVDRTLTEVQEDTYRIIDELREVAHGIHPPVLSDQGLVAAVRSTVRRLPIPVTVDADESLCGARFALGVEESAFFLVSEALTNVLKHAEATRVAIRLSQLDGSLVVEVADDGVGLPVDQNGGTGLTGMRDRVEAIGGDLRFTKAGQPGTTIVARLPVRQETANG